MNENRPGYKKTKLGWIPEEWEVVRLKETCEIKGGKRIPKGYKLQKKQTPYPYIRVLNLKMGYIDRSNIQYISENIFKKIKRYTISKDDLYITVAGTLGVVGSIPKDLDKANLTENADKLCNISCNKEFLKYILMSEFIQKEIKKIKTSNAQPKLALKWIRRFRIPLPPLQEQKKIAEILTTVDEKIESIQDEISKTEDLKKGLMQKLFSEGIGHTKFKDTKIGRIPEEWEVKKLKNICNVRRGASPRPIKDPKWFGGEIGWVRISDVSKSNKYLYKTKEYLSEAGVQKSVLLKKNSVVFSICATIGSPIILKMDACIHDGFVWFEELPNSIHSEYLYYYLLNSSLQISSKSQKGTQGNLNTKIVGNYYLLIPPLQEQEKIAEILTCTDNKLETLKEKQEEYKTLKKGLMQKLLTGNIKIKV